MIGGFGGTTVILGFLIYLAVIGFLLWMIYRFITAHEQVAKGITRIEEALRKENKEQH